MSRPIRIEEPEGPRFELALDQLESGSTFVFLDCGVRVENAILRVYVPTECEPHSITEERALSELLRAKRNIKRLEALSSRFAGILPASEPVYTLIYDYGTGGVWICDLRGDELSWREGFPSSPAT